MRGHEAMVDMRRRGFVPTAVWVHDLPLEAQRTPDRWNWPLHGQSACIDLDPTDNPARLDLRFVVGLTVWIQARDAQRLQALTDLAVACGAKRVLGSLVAGEGDRARCVAHTDTQGVLTWQT